MKTTLITALIIIITAFSRLAVADFDYGNLSFDSGNFALAVKDFSLQNDRPHLPGYILYVGFLKVLARITDSPGVLAAIIFSSLSAGILFLVLKKYFLKTDAILLTLFVMFNPMAWFSGATAEIYSFDLLFSSALVLAGISGRWIYFTPLLMALGGGFRQSSPFLLLPLYGYLWWRFLKTPGFSFKKFFASHIAGIAAVLLWLIPMVHSTGGFKNYITLFTTNSPLPPTSFFQNIAQFAGFGVFLLAPFLIVVSAFLFKNFFKSSFKNRQEILPENSFKKICFWWVVPPILFFLFGHYNSSYFLICIGGAAGLLHSLFKNNVRLSRFAFSAGIILSAVIFFAIPYKLPSIETSFAPQNRSISQVEVFKSRVFSAYLLGNARIREMKNYARITEGMTNTSLADTTIKAVFFDPTFPVVVRAFQPISHLPLTTLNVQNSGSYFEYSGITQSEKSSFKNSLERSIIATRKDFADNFLQEFSFKSRKDLGELCFLKVAPHDAARLANLYDSLFVKR